jgi:hypothetical protein
MHAKLPGLEPGRSQHFLTEETAFTEWSRVIADKGFHHAGVPDGRTKIVGNVPYFIQNPAVLCCFVVVIQPSAGDA